MKLPVIIAILLSATVKSQVNPGRCFFILFTLMVYTVFNVATINVTKLR